MVALRIQDRQEQQTSGQHQRRLIKRMNRQYWRIAGQERIICNIGGVIRQDLHLLPVQCNEAAAHLLRLRQAAQVVHNFYQSLDPQAMKAVAPWGVLVKLRCLEEQTTELILLLNALVSTEEPSYNRVQLQLATRRLYPLMFVTYDETASQLAALVVKAQEAQV